MTLRDAVCATKNYNIAKGDLGRLKEKSSEQNKYLTYLHNKCRQDSLYQSGEENIQKCIEEQMEIQKKAIQDVQAMLSDLEVQIQEVQTFLDELKPKCLHSFSDADILEGEFDFHTMALWKSCGLYYVCLIEDLKYILNLGDVVFLRKTLRHGCVPILKPLTSKYSPKDLNHFSFAIFVNMANSVVGEITSDALFKWFGWKGIIPFLTFLDDKVVLVGNQLEINPLGGKPFFATSEKLMFRFVNGTGVLFDPETLPWFEFQGLRHCAECEFIGRNHQKICAHTAVHKAVRAKAQLEDERANFIIEITTKMCPICSTRSAKETYPREACNHMECSVCMSAGRPKHWCFRCGGHRNSTGQLNMHNEVAIKCSQDCLDRHNFCQQYSLAGLPDGTERYVITGCKH